MPAAANRPPRSAMIPQSSCTILRSSRVEFLIWNIPHSAIVQDIFEVLTFEMNSESANREYLMTIMCYCKLETDLVTKTITGKKHDTSNMSSRTIFTNLSSGESSECILDMACVLHKHCKLRQLQDHLCPKNSKLKNTHKRQQLEQKCLVTYGRLNGFKSLSGTDPPNRAASVATFTSTQRTISPK
jgi:hypothetical protein